MNTQIVIKIPLNNDEYKSLLFYVNKENYGNEYIVKRDDALKNFSNFLSRREQEYLEKYESITDVIFYANNT